MAADIPALAIGLMAVAATEFPHAFVPVIRLGRRHACPQIHARQARERPCRLQCDDFVNQTRHDAAGLRAGFAQRACQTPRIDIGNPHDTLAFEVIRQ